MNLPQQHGKTPRQMLRLKDVVKLCGLSKSQIMEHARHGAFPRPIKLTDRAGPSSSFKTKSQIGKQPAPRSGGGAVMSDPRPPLTSNSAGPSSNHKRRSCHAEV